MKLIFISSWFPYPTDNGSKIRILNLLKGLSKHHQVTLFTFSRNDNYLPYIPILNNYCHRVFVAPWNEFTPHRRHALRGYFNMKPRSMVETYSPEMEGLIRQEINTNPSFDMVIFSQLDSINYINLLSGIPAILEEVELGTLYDDFRNACGVSVKLRKGITWWKTRSFLQKHIPEFRVCTVVSDKEKKILNSISPKYQNVEIIPNCIEISEYPFRARDPEPNQIIFTGSLRYPVNLEAMNYFVQEIFPILKRKSPEIKLLITGNQEGIKTLPGEEDPHITYTGFINNIQQLVSESCVSIGPIKTGGGTRLKILEAFAIGTPVVATSKAVEGLESKNKIHLLISDTPLEFAESVCELLRNPGLCASLSIQARRLVEERYDWEKVLPKFLNILKRIEIESN